MREEIDVIIEYLTCTKFVYNGKMRYSSLNAALRECRFMTKRDSITGEYNEKLDQGYIGHWLGAIGYFTILDQLGSCFSIESNRCPSKNMIECAIKDFGYDLIENNDRILHALLALRNAFTHDFNLLNIPSNPSKKNLQQHKFTVTADINDQTIIKLPEVLWNGDVINKKLFRTNDITYVNLFTFGNLVENIHKRIIDKIKSGQAIARIDNHELLHKYTFGTTIHQI